VVHHRAAASRKFVRKATLEQAQLSLKQRWTYKLTEIVLILVHQGHFTGVSESDRQLTSVNIERYCVNIAGKTEDGFKVLLVVDGESIDETCCMYIPHVAWT